MQYAPLVLAVFLVGVTFSQNWDTDQFEDVGKGDNNLDFDKYITNKRAIDKQLRRSSIRWGKRTVSFTNDNQAVPLTPEGMMTLWPAYASQFLEKKVVANQNENKIKTTTLAKQDEDRKNKEDPIMERVAKGGIRPKLALSSRLWGR